MENNKLPVRTSKRSNPLWEDIRKFTRKKYGLAGLLVFVGLLGIFIPVIPGLLLMLLALALFKPGLMSKIRSKLNSLF